MTAVPGTLQVFPTRRELGIAAARYVSQLASQAVTRQGYFTVALSGGSLPGILGPALTSEPLRYQIDWSTWHVFWVDERCVPLTSPDSNFYAARMYILDHVDIPSNQVHPATDGTLSPLAAAGAYQVVLAEVFRPVGNQMPRFDLILLGMGEDGHTASLFPRHSLLDETERWVASVIDSPKPPPERVTFTLPLLNNARHVAFLAAGAGKAEMLARVLTDEVSPNVSVPASLVRPVDGDVQWFVDNAAIGRMDQQGARAPGSR